MEPLLARGCRDASQDALVAAGKMLGSEEFRCSGAEGDFGKERHDKDCKAGAAALGTGVASRILGCKALMATSLQPVPGLRGESLQWGPQIHLPKETPRLRLDFAMISHGISHG